MSSVLKIVETDEPECFPVTSHMKGRTLEMEFSVFMKEKLGWEKVRVGAHLPGKFNRKGASVDVIGECLSEKGVFYNNLGKAWMILSGICFALSLLCMFTGIGTGKVFMFSSMVMLSGGWIALRLSKKHNSINSLAECKNLKGKTNINHIEKSLREKNDYESTGDTEYKFTHHYFVSANGFMENALKYAKEHGIFCFEKNGNDFVEVNYWN